jgi:hypothetical protein
MGISQRGDDNESCFRQSIDSQITEKRMKEISLLGKTKQNSPYRSQVKMLKLGDDIQMLE